MSLDVPVAFRPRYVNLPGKPGRSIAYTLSYPSLDPKGPQDDGTLIVFVNGLGVPQAQWQPAIELLRQDLKLSTSTDEEANTRHTVSIITYDRDGQGLSQKPGDAPPQSHDITASVDELHAMISLFRPHRRSKIFLVAHSVGVPLSRLYCHKYSGTVSALLAVDSNIANTDFISLMPDPDDATIFDAVHDLPSDTTIEDLRFARDNYRKMFHPLARNPENLDRSNLATLLPASDSPVLLSPNGDAILLTVIGHDPETFATESLKISTRGLTEKYMQPAWSEYNHGLLKIGRALPNQVVIAAGSGHFVQRDNPRCVADQVLRMLRIVDRSRHES